MSQSIIIDSEGARGQVKEMAAAFPMIGQSPGMKRVQHLALKIGPTDSSVLITGETGTGKEMLARAIHALSPRHDRPFVAVNASAIPENLQESELFGHRKGSFTGATQDRKGLFEEASSGTLFLDEIGDTSPSLQVKLLRALETRVIRRVGDGGERMVDVRVLAATHRDLVELVKRGEFREDLFFRLNVVQLHLPPLRERGSDIELFLETFLKRYCLRQQKKLQGFDKESFALLTAYLYPGNIRELDNIVHHAVLMADGQEITVHDLPPYLLARPRITAGAGLSAVQSQGRFGLDLGDGFVSLMDMEKSLIEATLNKLAGNQSTAAKKLGISRSTLWRKMKEYGIEM